MTDIFGKIESPQTGYPLNMLMADFLALSPQDAADRLWAAIGSVAGTNVALAAEMIARHTSARRVGCDADDAIVFLLNLQAKWAKAITDAMVRRMEMEAPPPFIMARFDHPEPDQATKDALRRLIENSKLGPLAVATPVEVKMLGGGIFDLAREAIAVLPEGPQRDTLAATLAGIESGEVPHGPGHCQSGKAWESLCRDHFEKLGLNLEEEHARMAAESRAMAAAKPVGPLAALQLAEDVAVFDSLNGSDRKEAASAAIIAAGRKLEAGELPAPGNPEDYKAYTIPAQGPLPRGIIFPDYVIRFAAAAKEGFPPSVRCPVIRPVSGGGIGVLLKAGVGFTQEPADGVALPPHWTLTKSDDGLAAVVRDELGTERARFKRRSVNDKYAAAVFHVGNAAVLARFEAAAKQPEEYAIRALEPGESVPADAKAVAYLAGSAHAIELTAAPVEDCPIPCAPGEIGALVALGFGHVDGADAVTPPPGWLVDAGAHLVACSDETGRERVVVYKDHPRMGSRVVVCG